MARSGARGGGVATYTLNAKRCGHSPKQRVTPFLPTTILQGEPWKNPPVVFNIKSSFVVHYWLLIPTNLVGATCASRKPWRTLI